MDDSNQQRFDIKQYGSGQLSALEGLEERRVNLLHTFKDIYGLEDRDLTLPEATKHSFLRQWDNITSAWPKKRDDAMRADNISQHRAPLFDKAASRIVMDYLEAFYIRRQLLKQHEYSVQEPFSRGYGTEEARRALSDIYVNTVGNRAEAMLSALGLSTEQSHILHGSLVGLASKTYTSFAEQNKLDHPDEVYVYPRQQPRDRTPEEMREEITDLKNYWRKREADLRTAVTAYDGPNR